MRRITKVAAIAATAVTALIATAGSASAATTTSPDPACTPVTEVIGVPEVSHPEYKYVLADGTPGHVRFSTESAATMDFGDGVAYVADLNKQGQHKTETIITTPAVQAVDGVTCVIPLPANPLTDASVIPNFVAPSDTATFTWGTLTDNRLLNGKVGIRVTASPGYVFAYGNGTLSSKVFALDVSTPLPASPLTGLTHETVASFVAPTTDGVVWSTLVDNRAINGKVGISATPTAGRVFEMPNGTYSFATKNFALYLGVAPTA
jgi:hypothetical protein